MWLFTNIGFFSVVRKPRETRLTVRARVASDLDALRAQYLPELGPTVEGAGTDYRFRARVDAADLARATAAMIEGISYSNFKSEVRRAQGPEREATYHRVWDEMLGVGRGGKGLR